MTVDFQRADVATAAPRGRRDGADPGTGETIDPIVDEWGRQSFPASDPPENW